MRLKRVKVNIRLSQKEAQETPKTGETPSACDISPKKAMGKTFAAKNRLKHLKKVARRLTFEEAKQIYHHMLAEIWHCPVENIKTTAHKAPVITILK